MYIAKREMLLRSQEIQPVNPTEVVSSHPAQKKIQDEQVVFDPQYKNTRMRGTGREREIRSAFHEVVANYRDPSEPLSTQGDIFETYRESLMLQKTFYRQFLKASQIESDELFRKNLNGAIFEDIARLYMTPKFNSFGQTVIHEETVYTFWKRFIYPSQTVQEGEGKKTIYRPDGLLVNDKGCITGMLEYSLSNDPEKFKPQHEGVHEFSERFPLLMSENPRFIVITPQTYSRKLASDLSAACQNVQEGEESCLDIVPLPYSRRDIYKFINSIYKTYRPMSLAEVRRKKQEDMYPQIGTSVEQQGGNPGGLAIAA